jgi:hypothetical protein
MWALIKAGARVAAVILVAEVIVGFVKKGVHAVKEDHGYDSDSNEPAPATVRKAVSKLSDQTLKLRRQVGRAAHDIEDLQARVAELEQTETKE